MSDGAPAPAKSGPGGSGQGYFALSERPWHSLLFILPIIAAYEIGIRVLARTAPTDAHPQIVAFALMQRFFLWMGATGVMLPALAVVVILLAWHIARKDGWNIRPAIYVGMGLESLILTAPLVAIGMALPQHLPLWSIDRPASELLVLACGAGVYEELVFRLVGMTLLSLLLADILRIPSRAATTITVILSAAAFALYHYLGHEAFQWRSMVFRTIAGVYFSLLFVTRGFGVTVGTHTAYDIAIVALRHFAAAR